MINSLEKKLYVDMFNEHCFSTFVGNNTIKELIDKKLIDRLSNEHIRTLLELREIGSEGDSNKEEDMKRLKDFVDKF